jgi:hypothetical protein
VTAAVTPPASRRHWRFIRGAAQAPGGQSEAVVVVESIEINGGNP